MVEGGVVGEWWRSGRTGGMSDHRWKGGGTSVND